ncbi:hypothetical protein THTE_1536 [Thermogutta terrifontis]|uniref:Uncharacterized protein n=1 Tax=Thermogutta terrifontis TaxID=1331910 RepID=A0A286RDV1_9BACT|nr:hypothetical protein THTE_1536 [Thermogutta terrifontis]
MAVRVKGLLGCGAAAACQVLAKWRPAGKLFSSIDWKLL